MWLDEKLIGEGLDHKKLQEITIKYHSNLRKHRDELVEEPKKQCNRTVIVKNLATKVIMDCRTTATQRFKSKITIQTIGCHF